MWFEEDRKQVNNPPDTILISQHGHHELSCGILFFFFHSVCFILLNTSPPMNCYDIKHFYLFWFTSHNVDVECDCRPTEAVSRILDCAKRNECLVQRLISSNSAGWKSPRKTYTEIRNGTYLSASVLLLASLARMWEGVSGVSKTEMCATAATAGCKWSTMVRARSIRTAVSRLLQWSGTNNAYVTRHCRHFREARSWDNWNARSSLMWMRRASWAYRCHRVCLLHQSHLTQDLALFFFHPPCHHRDSVSLSRHVQHFISLQAPLGSIL